MAGERQLTRVHGSTHRRYDPVEPTARIPEPMLTRRKFSEIASSPGNDIIIQLEGNPSEVFRVHGDIKLIIRMERACREDPVASALSNQQVGV